MPRILLPAVLLLAMAAAAQAGPEHAVVRIPSHGGSGTVIATGPGQTWILSAAHLFEGDKLNAPIVVDAPAPTTGPTKSVGVRRVKLDRRADLSLILLNAGPLPYVTPVAPAGYRPAECISVGYDGPKGKQGPQQQTFTMKAAHILGQRAHTDGSRRTLTREPPWHGRSGGGLIDTRGYLVGVVSAYENPNTGPGIYSTHEDILAFLASPTTPQTPPTQPRQVLQYQTPSPRQFSPLQFGASPQGCPGGT